MKNARGMPLVVRPIVGKKYKVEKKQTGESAKWFN
jgi:hypothetical protein